MWINGISDRFAIHTYLMGTIFFFVLLYTPLLLNAEAKQYEHKTWDETMGEIHPFLIRYAASNPHRTMVAVQEPRDIRSSQSHLAGIRLAESLEAYLMTHLPLSGGDYQLTARSRIDTVIHQLELQHTDFFDKHDFQQIGSMLGATLLLLTEDGISQGQRKTIMKLVELETGKLIGCASSWNFPPDQQSELIQRVSQSITRMEHPPVNQCTLVVLPKGKRVPTPEEKVVLTRIESLLLDRLSDKIDLLSGSHLSDVQALATEYSSGHYDHSSIFQSGGWEPADVIVTVDVSDSQHQTRVHVNIIELATAQLLDAQTIQLTTITKKPNDYSSASNIGSQKQALTRSLSIGFGGWFSTQINGEFLLLSNIRFTHAPLEHFRWAVEGGYGQNINSKLGYGMHYYFLSALLMGQLPFTTPKHHAFVLYAGVGGRFAQGIRSSDPGYEVLPFSGVLFDVGIITPLFECRILSINAGTRFDFETQVGLNLFRVVQRLKTKSE